MKKDLPHKVLISLNDEQEVELTDKSSQHVVSSTLCGDIVCCGTCKLEHTSAKKEDDILAFMTRSGDERVTILQASG
jgi:hypothetical protein